MPVLAACRTCTPLPMPSSRLLMSLARPSSDWAVKKLVGLSSAVFTFLPVERRLCVVASRSAVDCSESKFWRTEDERTMPDILLSFWMNTIDATPHVSVGDGATLFSQRYLFVKFSLRTNTRKWQWPDTSRMQVCRDCHRDPIEAMAAKTLTQQPFSRKLRKTSRRAR